MVRHRRLLSRCWLAFGFHDDPVEAITRLQHLSVSPTWAQIIALTVTSIDENARSQASRPRGQ